jgi:predicted tellurium resistance membrane protein TerC
MLDIFSFENILALVFLTTMEIVLGIDNIIFIAILVDRLEKSKQKLARNIGLFLAMGARIALLLVIGMIMKITFTLFTIGGNDFSGRDLILIAGGFFLIWKATTEIHEKFEEHSKPEQSLKAKSFNAVIIQIVLLDIVFSLDSVLTAIGMAKEIWIMVTAIIIAVGVMMVFAGTISEFIKKHPTLKILGLAFLILVGVVLIADGFGSHINKGYIYFAMAFSLAVETINLKLKRHEK